MTLFEIDAQMEALTAAMTDPETGEFTGDFDAWNALQMARAEKLEKSGVYLKKWTAQITALKNEEEALAKRRKVLTRKRDWMRENLARSLDGENFETAAVAMRFKRNPEKVVYTDEAETVSWAQQYAQDCLKEPRPELSTAAVKKRLQTGEAVPGAELVQETRLEVI